MSNTEEIRKWNMPWDYAIATKSVRNKFQFVFDLFEIKDFAISGSSVVNEYFKIYHNSSFISDGDSVDIDLFPYSQESYIKMKKELVLKGFLSESVSPFDEKYVKDKLRIDLVTIFPEDKRNNYPDFIYNLKNFDILACAIMICDKEVFVLTNAIEDIKRKRITVINMNSFSRNFKRIVKYASRGFSMGNEENRKFNDILRLYEESNPNFLKEQLQTTGYGNLKKPAKKYNAVALKEIRVYNSEYVQSSSDVFNLRL